MSAEHESDIGPGLRRYEPELSEAGLEQQWGNVESRISKPRSSFMRLVIASGSLAAVAAGLLIVLRFFPSNDATSSIPTQASARGTETEGLMLTAGAVASSAMLADGSRIELDAGAMLLGLPHATGEVAFEVERGRATFDVVPASRRFVVTAGQVQVVVLGTRFSVQHDHGDVRVQVERGRVEVRRGDVLATLTEGNAWSGAATIEDAIPSSFDPTSAPESDDVRSERQPVRSPSAPVERREREAESETRSAAQILFERAQAERREGRFESAAAQLDELLAEHGSDPRAAVAAYELGCIRMDALEDRGGASRALQRALRLSPRASFAEDALARLVRAYDEMGAAECAGARERYLSLYPDGRHRAGVLQRCATR